MSAITASERTQRSPEKPGAEGMIKNPALAQQLLEAFDAAFGLHAGFRPAHAKVVDLLGFDCR